jgi:hypothetical protein
MNRKQIEEIRTIRTFGCYQSVYRVFAKTQDSRNKNGNKSPDSRNAMVTDFEHSVAIFGYQNASSAALSFLEEDVNLSTST